MVDTMLQRLEWSWMAVWLCAVSGFQSVTIAQGTSLSVPLAHVGNDDDSCAAYEPLPESGPVPGILGMFGAIPQAELEQRAKARQYERDLRIIRHRHFGAVRKDDIRAQGLAMLTEFSDPAAFQPMIEVFAREQDDVRLAMLDHFSQHGAEGQGALAWVAIFDRDEAMRAEAHRRMTSPPSDPVRRVLDIALRKKDHAVVAHAASLAASLNVVETIPLLIFAQAVPDIPNDRSSGDLAWIAIETQRAYVAALVPVVGDGAAAFAPVIGTVSEGVVLRVVDAVAISYRTEVHDSLVALSTNDWGQPTANLDYNVDAWWHWYNTQYVPFKQEQAKEATLAAEPPATSQQP